MLTFAVGTRIKDDSADCHIGFRFSVQVRASDGHFRFPLARNIDLDLLPICSHLIARRVRELKVFCELYSCKVDAAVLDKVAILILTDF